VAITKAGRTVLLVRDLDEALGFYKEKLGFEIIFDGEIGDGYRALHVGPKTHRNVGIWLIKSESPEQQALIGRQTGGQPFMVFYTDDCRATYEELKNKGVEFEGDPVEGEDDVTVFFKDLYGNRFVLVQLQNERYAPL
jgi:catechol 2,3-dioxygenase-like lactoylglutathione lyase family enzyme